MNLAGTSSATTRTRLKSRATIRAVRAHRLAQQSPGLPDGLPDELLAVAVPPAGPAWAEHRVRFVLEFVGDGVSGWHGPVSETILTIIRDAHAPGLLGHDAAGHRRLPCRKVLGRHHHGSHARQAQAAVELACWDLASRACRRTVSDLLGGTVRRHVPLYATALGLDLSHPDAPAAAEWIHAAGFWGQKWALPKEVIADGPGAVSACLHRVQEAVPHGRFMVDGLGRCRADEAVRLLPILAGLGITWAEELVPDRSPAWQRLRAAGVPLAAGEHAVDPEHQARLLSGGNLDVWQPDPGWAGLARSLHTADVAADSGLPTFPHGSHLPAAAALASVCCRDQIPAVEYHLTVEPHRQSIFTNPAVPSNGQLRVRTDPGLTNGYLISDPTPTTLAQEDR